MMLQRNVRARRLSMTLVKKYSNRRLYDTDDSRYITLDELAVKIREGNDVQVVDAKTGEDLTQGTLTQLILEGPAAKLLPVPLLRQLIRMQDDALAEFLGKYVTAALDLYLAARDGAEQVAPYFPFASVPMQATQAFLRLFSGNSRESSPRPARTTEDTANDMAALRRELAELRDEMRNRHG
jgi:polyhydroxyalkanoate synthesis repressor PhaR